MADDGNLKGGIALAAYQLTWPAIGLQFAHTCAKLSPDELGPAGRPLAEAAGVAAAAYLIDYHVIPKRFTFIDVPLKGGGKAPDSPFVFVHSYFPSLLKIQKTILNLERSMRAIQVTQLPKNQGS